MRSKTLLVSNILSAVYTAILWYIFGGAIFSAGGMDYLAYCRQTFSLAYEMIGFDSLSLNIVYVVVILFLIHIAAFTLGTLIGWIGYITKKSGAAKFAAVLYLIGTICFPIYIFFGLPITVIGFIAGGKQKKLNSMPNG